MCKIEFDEERCKGCELCTIACPKKLIVMSEGLNSMGYHPAKITNQEECTSCTLCAKMCPDVVITVRREEKQSAKGSDERE